MRMELSGSLLKMTPEKEDEKNELNELWKALVDCTKDSKKLAPVGEYVPGVKESATFSIE